MRYTDTVLEADRTVLILWGWWVSLLTGLLTRDSSNWCLNPPSIRRS